MPSSDSCSRRGFLAGAAAAGAFAALPAARAAEPVQRPGEPYFKLSLAGYSFNRLMPRTKPKEQWDEAEMTLDDFVRYCAEHNLPACEPTAYYFPKDVTQEYLLHLKQMAFRLGLDISGTAIGNDFCLPEGEARQEQLRMTREWIDHAAVLGAPVIRIFAGKVPEGDTEEAALERCVAGINESLDHAEEKGVFLALENHGGVTATPEQLLSIVKAVRPSPWFGINFDSGNFNTDDPYRDLAKIAPYAVNAQVKVQIKRNDVAEPADFERILGILRDAGYRGYVVLEYEGSDPLAEVPGYLDKLRKLL